MTHRQNVLLVLCTLHACDQPQQQVHHGASGDVREQQPGEALLDFDVLDDL